MAVRKLNIKKDYYTPDGRKIKKFIHIGGKVVPIAEEKPASEETAWMDDNLRKTYSRFIDDHSHDDQLDSDEKEWVEALRREKYGDAGKDKKAVGSSKPKELKPWSAAEKKRSEEMSKYVYEKVFKTGDEQGEFYEENFVEDLDTKVISVPGWKDEEITLSKCNLIYAQNWDEEDRRVKRGKAVTGSTYYLVQTDNGSIDEDTFAYKTKADAQHAMELYIRDTTEWRKNHK